MEQSYFEDGDLICGIDLLGNVGFVCNVVEKVCDYCSFCLDDEDFDVVLVSDFIEFSEDQLC